MMRRVGLEIQLAIEITIIIRWDAVANLSEPCKRMVIVSLLSLNVFLACLPDEVLGLVSQVN